MHRAVKHNQEKTGILKVRFLPPCSEKRWNNIQADAVKPKQKSDRKQQPGYVGIAILKITAWNYSFKNFVLSHEWFWTDFSLSILGIVTVKAKENENQNVFGESMKETRTPVFRFPRPWTPDPALQQLIERECRKIDAVFCAEKVVSLCAGKVNNVFLDDREIFPTDLSA